jgi:hypothetical protein
LDGVVVDAVAAVLAVVFFDADLVGVLLRLPVILLRRVDVDD